MSYLAFPRIRMSDAALTEVVTVRFSLETLERLRKEAVHDDRDVSYLIRRWVEERLEKEGRR